MKEKTVFEQLIEEQRSNNTMEIQEALLKIHEYANKIKKLIHDIMFDNGIYMLRINVHFKDSTEKLYQIQRLLGLPYNCSILINVVGIGCNCTIHDGEVVHVFSNLVGLDIDDPKLKNEYLWKYEIRLPTIT